MISKLISTENIIDILVEHFDYFLETEKIKKMDCEDCIKNNFPLPPNPGCKLRIYKNELDFYEYYNSLRYLLELKTISEEIIKPFLQRYHRIKHNKRLLEDCYWDADRIKRTSLNNYYFKNVIMFENEIPIGMKPRETDHYEENPFMIPIDGYESFIEYEFITKHKLRLSATPLKSDYKINSII